MRHIISDGALEVAVDERGAEAVSVRHAGRERLWQNEDGSWAGHAPLLFPVCGHCAVWLGGHDFKMPTHGFARKMPFAVTAHTQDLISLRLQSGEETRAVYPYDFTLDVTYRVQGNSLSTHLVIGNPGQEELYASCGFHPSFALSAPMGEYRLRFPGQEHFLHLVHDEGGLLTGETCDLGTGKELVLCDDLLREGRTLIFRVCSKQTELVRGGAAEATLCFEAPYLLLWRPQGAPMLCIEPWYNLPDRANAAPVAFSERQDIFRIPPLGQRCAALQIIYH